MKRTPFIFIVSILILGCTDKPDYADRKMKERCFVDQLIANEDYSMELIERTGNSSRPSTLTIRSKITRLESLRQRCDQEASLQSLLWFSDSIIARYQSLKEKDEALIAAIKTYHDRIIHAPDSANILSLKWCIAVAEGRIIHRYAHDIGGWGDLFYPLFSTVVSDSVIKAGDTLYVKVDVFINSSDWSFDFSKVLAENLRSEKKISPTIMRLGDIFLLRYTPHEKGKYKVNGKARMWQEESNMDEYPLEAEFKVE